METRYDCICRHFKLNSIVNDVFRTEELQYFCKLCPTIAALKWGKKCWRICILYYYMNSLRLNFITYLNIKNASMTLGGAMSLIKKKINSKTSQLCLFLFFILLFQGQVHLYLINESTFRQKKKNKTQALLKIQLYFKLYTAYIHFSV